MSETTRGAAACEVHCRVTEDELVFAIWRSYWPDQTEQWIREHWEVNAKIQGDHVQRVPRALARVVMEHLSARSADERGSRELPKKVKGEGDER